MWWHDHTPRIARPSRRVLGSLANGGPTFAFFCGGKGHRVRLDEEPVYGYAKSLGHPHHNACLGAVLALGHPSHGRQGIACAFGEVATREAPDCQEGLHVQGNTFLYLSVCLGPSP